MTQGFGKFLSARRRGCVVGAMLEAHHAAHGQTVAPSVLHQYLLSIGFKPTLNEVVKDCEFLASKNLLSVNRIDGHMFVAITQEGIECANRRITIAGVDMTEIGGV
jgi:hypothetical protein